MLELLVLLVVLGLLVFVGGWLLTCSFMKEELTMKERLAVVFEVYRYAVCFFCVLFFGLTGHGVIAGVLTAPGNTAAIAGPGIGVLLSAALFALHWRLKNPNLTVD